jgi:sugar phosphate isomerase/epimerase
MVRHLKRIQFHGRGMHTMAKNQILLHSLVAKYSTLAMDIDIAKAVGFDGLEMSQTKLNGFLDAGYSSEELRTLVKDISIPGIGFLTDVERQGEKLQLLASAEKVFQLASLVGAKGVQVLTGPVDVNTVIRHARGLPINDRYTGLLGRPETEQVRLTAQNMAMLADLARRYGLLLYLEALAWTPLNTIEKQLEVIDRAERENIRLVIDFWHCYASGDTPDVIAKLNKEVIYGVHVCDSLKFDGGVPDEEVLRDVPTGQGVLDLELWVAAVKATGYEGWWSCELFCKKQHQQNSYSVARDLRALLGSLVGV